MVKGESHIPRLRFKGFSDVWKQKKLSEISSRVQEKNKDNQVTETFTNSAERGIINQRDFFDKDISNEANLDNYYIVQPDDFVYNPRISNFAPVGPIKRNKLGRLGVMSPLYSVFRPDSNLINLDYLEHYFSTTNWHKFMFTHGDQGARSDRFAIGMATFQKMPISLPFLKEQTQIGNFFQKIDQVIELQQKALDTARDYKKSMLQKMFPQKGEKVPQIRFDGFSGDWEWNILNFGITRLIGGVSIAPEDYQNKGIATIPKGAINSSGLADISSCKYVLKDFAIKNQMALVKIGDFITSLRDLVPSAPNLGRIVKIPDSNIETYLMPQGVYKLVLNGNIENNFLITYSSLNQFRQLIFEVKNGTTQVHLRNQEFLNLPINLPSLQEQQKIGVFFQKLDQRIEQHEKKLESYQNLKKAMLQRLFV